MRDVTVEVRVTGPGDVDALAALRALWSEGEEPEFAARMAEWLESEGQRRTTWLALSGGEPLGMASLFEYRRMPRPGRAPSRWGYVSNMFVRVEHRNRGVGRALLTAILDAADERGYARLVLSPSEAALPLYESAGFAQPAGEHRLLVRPGSSLRRPAGTAGTGR
jgi:GNAT superfamily N-acetyltransferase